MDLPSPLYSEARVPDYKLPALGDCDSTLQAFADNVYGHFPSRDVKFRIESVEADPAALSGLAYRRQIRVTLFAGSAESHFDLLVYTPAAASSAVPLFLGLNFFGNHTIHADPAIHLTGSWCPDDKTKGVVNHRATEAGRGVRAARWPVEMILKAGYGLATVYYGDFAPDDPGHVHEGVLAFYPTAAGDAAKTRGGAISAWAWGLSRALDELVASVPEIDANRVAVIGHSRLGKAALWAGACDARFALVVSNNSGCGGASLARRRIGERLIHINSNFPHWFAQNYHAFNEHEASLPVDQHQLLALIAPRAAYVASAVDDRWADPRGEYLALAAAAPSWNTQLPAEPPGPDEPLHRGRLGYHLRTGAHDITDYDWRQFLAFANKLWKLPGQTTA